MIHARLAQTLLDPGSAQVQIDGPPVQSWSRVGDLKFGYATCGWVNAKNRFGGYVGRQRNYWLIRYGVVVREFSDGEKDIPQWARVSCDGLTRDPGPQRDPRKVKG